MGPHQQFYSAAEQYSNCPPDSSLSHRIALVGLLLCLLPWLPDPQLLSVEADSGGMEVISTRLLLSSLILAVCGMVGCLLNRYHQRCAAVDFLLRQFSRIAEQSSSIVMVTDLRGEITWVNRRFATVTGYSPEEVLGRRTSFLSSGRQCPDFYRELWDCLGEGRRWQGLLQNRKKNAELYWVSSVISPLRDARGRISHYLCTQDDITEQRHLQDQLDYRTRHCVLTGLINRSEMEQRMERLLERLAGDDSHHALLFLGIDQFRLINESLGHIAGDQLLRQLSTLIRNGVRSRDSVARIGGDEFAVLLEHSDADIAWRVAEQLRQAIEGCSFSHDERPLRMTVSIGVVRLDRHSPSAAKVLSHADSACYTAKDQGRNRSLLHTDNQLLRYREEDLKWIGLINEGIEQNRFCLSLQAISGTAEGGACHYEVLIRYRDEQGGLVLPGSFLPVAERYGLSPVLDRWVIGRVCQLLARHPQVLPPASFLSINLSGLTLSEQGVAEFVTTMLAECDVSPQQLCFEITETAAITSLDCARRVILQLQSVGCRFALDDFGSGFSSFGYLKNLPVDFIKIDGLFVKDLIGDPVCREMVRSINDIGHLMGKQTIAEYVENQQVAEVLTEMGVDYLQGYGIGRPLPAESLFNSEVSG